jgi:HSP20 family protein
MGQRTLPFFPSGSFPPKTNSLGQRDLTRRAGPASHLQWHQLDQPTPAPVPPSRIRVGLTFKTTTSITMRLVRYTYPSYRNFTPALGGMARAPWSGLEAEIGRLFESALPGLGNTIPAPRFPVDLYEDKANAYVRAELPGVARDDINVELVDGALTITAARKTPAAEGQPEQSVSFSRSVTIPAEVQADKVGATYENGVLTVTLPKREEVQPKKITVAVK